MVEPDHRTIGLFEGARPAVVAVAVLSLFINLLMLSGPLFMLQIYDRVLASGSVPTLISLSIIVGVCYLFYGILAVFRARILGRIGQVFNAQSAPRVHRLTTIVNTSSAASSIDPIADFDRIRGFIAGPGLSVIFDLPWVLIYLVIIFLFSPWLGLTTAVGAVILTILMVSASMANRRRLMKMTDLSAQRTNMAHITRQNSDVVHGMGMHEALTARWLKINDKFAGSQLDVHDLSTGFSTSTQAFRMALQSAILAIGAYLAIFQYITPGVMIAASILSARALAPIEQGIGQWPQFMNMRISLARLSSMLQDIEQSQPKTELAPPKFTLSAENLFVKPAQARAPILNDINFSVPAGQAMAVLGPSGSGKSALAKSLTGVWPAAKGAVRADGIELSQWPAEKRGQFTGYLPQDIQMFDGTIAENICRFDANAMSMEITKAATLANAHDLISSFPDGYDTVIGPHGQTLSGGELQRIGLARAFFRDPRIIVLDEPNSNLDGEGEKALEDAISQMRDRGSIVVVITHKPRILKSMDAVLVIDKGYQRTFGPAETVLPKILRNPQQQAPEVGREEVRLEAAE